MFKWMNRVTINLDYIENWSYRNIKQNEEMLEILRDIQREIKSKTTTTVRGVSCGEEGRTATQSPRVPSQSNTGSLGTEALAPTYPHELEREFSDALRSYYDSLVTNGQPNTISGINNSFEESTVSGQSDYQNFSMAQGLTGDFSLAGAQGAAIMHSNVLGSAAQAPYCLQYLSGTDQTPFRQPHYSQDGPDGFCSDEVSGVESGAQSPRKIHGRVL